MLAAHFLSTLTRTHAYQAYVWIVRVWTGKAEKTTIIAIDRILAEFQFEFSY